MARTTKRTALLVATAGLASRALGCAETSPSGVVVAPVAPASSAVATNADAGAPSTDADTGAVEVDASAGGAPARFRACAADAECVAVPRVGCCHNGANEAVAASQKEAYAASFVCPEAHPICAMIIVRDTRRPSCDGATHLCTLH
jgi:hypothetical protein